MVNTFIMDKHIELQLGLECLLLMSSITIPSAYSNTKITHSGIICHARNILINYVGWTKLYCSSTKNNYIK